MSVEDVAVGTSRIHILPPLVANQIAAGEVVERPASVVKELLENALDAKADQVIIDISFGGLNAITVSDNGEGIAEADLLKAIHPHATSKIQNLTDLASVYTMGFRGEALASIASVSRLSIQSRPFLQAQAMELLMEGERTKILPCARNQGTTVVVRDLFYNAPVRKRFLKSARTEFLAIDRVVRCFALSAPHIAITLLHEGQCIVKVPAGVTEALRVQRLHKLLGKAFIEAALPLEEGEGDIALSGWVTHPSYARSQKDRIWTYVNGRMVNDKVLNHAIKLAYEGKLHPGRYPACVLYVRMDPHSVDVNVHPTKHELRFHDPRCVHDALRARLNAALTSTEPHRSHTGEHKSTFSAPRLLQAESGEADARWIPLCPEYALIYRSQRPFMLDVQALQYDCLWEQLNAGVLPFESRALLVPISISVPIERIAHMEACFESLACAGLTFTWLEEQRLLLRSVPVVVPHLDVQAFMGAVLASAFTSFDSICSLLAKHQQLHAVSATAMDQQNWLAYLATRDEASQARYMRALTAEQCRQVFAT